MTIDKGILSDADNTHAKSETPTSAAQNVADASPTPSDDGAPGSTSRGSGNAAPNAEAEAEPQAKAKSRAKSKADAKPAKGKKTSASRPPKSEKAKRESNPSSGFAAQLRARFAVPAVVLDRRLLPSNFLVTLDAAGLAVQSSCRPRPSWRSP